MQEMPRGRPRRTQGRTQRPTKEVTGKPDDIERVTSGLAGGRRKRSRKTTSPAAYPTNSNRTSECAECVLARFHLDSSSSRTRWRRVLRFDEMVSFVEDRD